MGIVISKLNGSLRNSTKKTRDDYLRLQQNRHRNVPVNTDAPTINQATVGEESTVDNGTWTSTQPVTYSYQWQLDGVDIIGQTASTILVLVGMLGSLLRCVVKATNVYGFTISYTVAIEVTV